MKMKKIIAGLLAATMMVFNTATVSAQDTISLNYDLKTYEEVSTKNYVNYFIDFNECTTNEYLLSDLENFDINFVDTNVNEIVGVQIIYSAYSKDKTKITNSVKYAKTYSLALDLKNYIYNPDVFTEKGVSLPVNEVNGLNLKPYILSTLGSSATEGVYGFNFISIHLLCESAGVDNVADVHGVCSLPTFKDSKGNVQVAARRYFNSISDKITDIEIYPFKTSLNPKPYKTSNGVTLYENDVLSALSSKKINGNYYTKPIAVINDAIANGENVKFIFNSYKGSVKENKVYSGLNYDWQANTFGQHLYPYYDNITYGSYSDSWNMNLFTGAIVINSEMTMQLNDVDAFEWSQSSLTFDWDSITAGKVTDAKTFLTSMLLYTPVDWYWDSLEVKVDNSIFEDGEDISAGEGIEGDGEELFEETEVIDKESEIEEVETVTTEASPKTGNSSMAAPLILVIMSVAAIFTKVLN